MLLEIAQPVSLLLCLLSLFRVFYAAFLTPASYWDQRIEPALGMLAVAAGICVASGLIFRAASLGAGVEAKSFASTLPVRLFCWAAGVMVVLFLLGWYLQTHTVLYRDVRRL
jgi:hypothetical protein